MDNNQLKDLETKIETSLKDFTEDITPKIEQINKFLDQEYEKEIDDQVNFLRNITVMAGVVAPFSLILLSEQYLEVQKTFLLIGFVLLLVTVLVALLSSKKLTLDKKYKDTSSLAFNHIIAGCSVHDLLDTGKSLSDRVNISAEILKNINGVNNKFSNLGYTNKLADLRNKLSTSNQWSILLFSFGLVSIIMSVIYVYLVNFLTYLLFLFMI